MKRMFLVPFGAMLVAGSAAYAGPINLITNGSFEQGTGSAGQTGTFNGWTVTDTNIGSGPGLGPQRVQYGPNTTAYGDNVAPDPFTDSPEATGTHAAFFVDDNAVESLSQTISLVAGTTYEVGFDFFETLSGASNPNFFTLSASLGNAVLATITSDVKYGAGTWYHVFEVFTPTVDSPNGTFTFTYTSGPSAAKDVIVDDVYVEVAPAGDIPEPASILALAVGLGALGYARSRGKLAASI
jgi:hypothetical protein